MQFQVPQFIEVEDKIFGPLTFRQFIYLVGGAGACYLIWKMLPQLIAAPLVLSVAGLAAALAFAQINGRPFIVAFESAFFYVIRGKLYLWNNDRSAAAQASVVTAPQQATASALFVPQLSGSKLRDLAWSLDIQEKVKEGMSQEEIRNRGINRSATPAKKDDVLSNIITARAALRNQ